MNKRCGFVAIIGRPNVGKSSLLNAILGKKVSITSFRPQTTRNQILGIKTVDNEQTVYVDTPGIHLAPKTALNRQMNKIANQSLMDVDAAIFVVEALQWTKEDELIAKLLKDSAFPIFMAINKIDLIAQKTRLLAYIEKVSRYLPSSVIVPISVKKNHQINELEQLLRPHLPESEFYFPEDQIVNHSDQFAISEIVREKLMRSFEEEIPYAVSVQVEAMEDRKSSIHIHTLIWVEREGQKGILIGEKGKKLRDIGIAARRDLERFFNKKVCLKLWVKVNEGWSNNLQTLKTLGYAHE